MKFNKITNILLLSAQALLLHAEKVTFKVLVVNGTPTLNIGGTQHKMSAGEYPLYVAEVDVDSFPVTYNYSVDGETEKFERKREKGAESLNEFFERQLTIVEHPKLPRAFKAFELAKPSKLYDDQYVGTVIVKTDKIEELYEKHNDEDFDIPAEVVYASPYAVKTFKNANFTVSGQSTRDVPKLSFKLKNLKDEKKKELYGRSSLKLRAEHMDPSFLRDKIYGDILNSLGVPNTQNKYVRLFINGEPIGLYNLSDSISSDHYLRNTFNEGKKFTADNLLYKVDCCLHCEGGASYGDLCYYGDDPSNQLYRLYYNKGKDKNTVDKKTKIQQDIIPLLKEIDAYKNHVTEKSPFNEDLFLRYMAMELLAGAGDNFWNKPGNYYLFKDTARNQWYFHDSDFHYSFGAIGPNELFMNTPISQYPPKLDELLDNQRCSLDAIRSRQENETKFMDIFKRLIKTSFNPNALYPRMESLAKLIKDDALWDFTLPRTNPSPTQDVDIVFTDKDFEDNVYGELPKAEHDLIPIRTFIKNRLNNVAQELNVEIPNNYESDLGFVEPPSSTKDEDSGSLNKYSWSIYSAIIVLFITLML